MNFPMFAFAILCGLVLAAVAVSLLALFRTKTPVRAAAEAESAGPDPAKIEAKMEAEVLAMRQTIEALAAQIQDAQQQSRVMAVPAMPKPGLNLTKRSQALRMHRRGDAPEQIATALEIPRQEVDLLLKVHKIVLSTVA